MKKQKTFKSTRSSKALGRTFNGRAHIDRLYDSDWEMYRRMFLAHNPFCYACANYAQHVDHITPHQGDVDLFWKEDNYLPLCAACHNTITALFDRYHAKGKSIDKKLRWIADMRLRKDVRLRVRVVTPLRNRLI